MKEFPSHLKYDFLEPEKRKPVIISVALTEFEEQKLLEILRKCKEAIAWSIEDLKGICNAPKIPYNFYNKFIIYSGYELSQTWVFPGKLIN